MNNNLSAIKRLELGTRKIREYMRTLDDPYLLSVCDSLLDISREIWKDLNSNLVAKFSEAVNDFINSSTYVNCMDIHIGVEELLNQSSDLNSKRYRMIVPTKNHLTQ